MKDTVHVIKAELSRQADEKDRMTGIRMPIFTGSMIALAAAIDQAREPVRSGPVAIEDIAVGWWWVRDSFSGAAEIINVTNGIAGSDLRYYRIEDLRARPLADLAKRYEVISRVQEPTR